MTTLQHLLQIIGLGIGATLVMDIWLMFLSRFGAATLNLALVGRWVGHLLRGQLSHKSIRESPRIPGELALGWLTHYAVGIAFAGLLIALQRHDWIQSPTLLPAVVFGMVTVVAPLFILQPAMGSGYASAKTPAPLKNCLRSLANHTMFGVGLYATAVLMAQLTQ